MLICNLSTAHPWIRRYKPAHIPMHPFWNGSSCGSARFGRELLNQPCPRSCPAKSVIQPTLPIYRIELVYVLVDQAEAIALLLTYKISNTSKINEECFPFAVNGRLRSGKVSFLSCIVLELSLCTVLLLFIVRVHS